MSGAVITIMGHSNFTNSDRGVRSEESSSLRVAGGAWAELVD